MKSYLSLIPISAKVHRRQNRMTLLCIVFAVFMVTAVFSMAEMGFRMEQARLVGKHGSFSIGDLLGSSMGQTLLSVAVVLFLLILVAGVLMISSSMNSSVAQRTKFFGMMRCIGMSKQQIIRFVRLEALNWCKTAVPIGLILGVKIIDYFKVDANTILNVAESKKETSIDSRLELMDCSKRAYFQKIFNEMLDSAEMLVS